MTEQNRIAALAIIAAAIIIAIVGSMLVAWLATGRWPSAELMLDIVIGSLLGGVGLVVWLILKV